MRERDDVVLAGRRVRGLGAGRSAARHVAIVTEDHGTGSLGVTTGAFTGLPDTYGDYHAWAPGGAYRAYGVDGEIVVTRDRCALPVGEAGAGALPERDVHFLADGGRLIRTSESGPGVLYVFSAAGTRTVRVAQPVPGALVLVTT